MTKFTTTALIAVFSMAALSGCASMNQKALKAPCGPTAGMTDPCGDAKPINDQDTIDGILTGRV